MRKLLFVASHLSTGGLPQYLVKKVELLINTFDVYVVEYSDVTGGKLVVQRNRLKSILKNELITLGEDKTKLLDIIKELNPDIIHMEEIPEMFCDTSIAKEIYKKDRPYFIYETCHDSSYEASNKQFFPDKMILVSNYQIKMFESLDIPIEVIDYPIEFSNNKLRERYRIDLDLDPNKKHILNVGLFTPRKNQKEFFEYARRLPQYQFHQVGNMADNFKFYWEPLLKDVPSNLKIWDERSDVYKFYEAMDLFLFTSKGTTHDKETMPLVLKEAISANIPIALYNLPVYENFFDQFNNIYYLNFNNMNENTNIIINSIEMPNEIIPESVFSTHHTSNVISDKELFNCRWDWSEQKMHYSVNESINYPIIVAIKEYKSDAVLWSTKYNGLQVGSNMWMLPIPKSINDYEKSEIISGVKFCVYNATTNEQIYEYPFFKKFINLPTVQALSNSEPYHFNYLEYFVNKKYDKYLNKQFKNVVDIGASVGVFTSYILYNKLSNNVVAVECDPTALRDLNRNFDIHPFVEIIDKAIHHENTVIDFYHSDVNSIISSTLSPEQLKNHKAGTRGDNVIKVDTVTISELIDKLGYIDLLKIDIEGGEYNIFEKLDTSLFKKINNLYIECHFFEENYKERYESLLKLLRGMGYGVIEYEQNQATKYIGGSEAIFASKNDGSLFDLYNAVKYNTDKGVEHDYIKSYYDIEFSNKKSHNLNILEIGIQGGDSIRLWNDYFSSSSIVGIDINDIEYSNVDGIDIIIGDAYDDKIINQFSDNKFDYIIDDGPHTLESQLLAIEKWTQKIKIGGKLIIEDIQSENDLSVLIKSVNIQKCQYKVFDLRPNKQRYDDIIFEITKITN